MKKSFLFLAALSCALFLFTGCPNPSSNPEVPAENPETPTSTDTPDTVTVCGITVELPTITIPELPSYSGNDIFAGKSFYTKLNYADGYVFGIDGTVIETRLENIEGSLQDCGDHIYGSGYATDRLYGRYGRYEYSYDSTHLYMRLKSVHNVDEAGTESWVTPQEYLKFVCTNLFEVVWGVEEEEAKEEYTEHKTSYDEQSGGSTFEDCVEWHLFTVIEYAIADIESLKTYDVVDGVIQYQNTEYVYNSEAQQHQLQPVTHYYSPLLSSDEDPFKDNTYENENNKSFHFGNDGTVCEYYGTDLYATYSYKCNSNYIYLACITCADIDTQTGYFLTDAEGNYILVSNSTYWEHVSSYFGVNMESMKSQLTILSYEGDTITGELINTTYTTYTLVED